MDNRENNKNKEIWDLKKIKVEIGCPES